jgi:hypothetical protein
MNDQKTRRSGPRARVGVYVSMAVISRMDVHLPMDLSSDRTWCSCSGSQCHIILKASVAPWLLIFQDFLHPQTRDDCPDLAGRQPHSPQDAWRLARVAACQALHCFARSLCRAIDDVAVRSQVVVSPEDRHWVYGSSPTWRSWRARVVPCSVTGKKMSAKVSLVFIKSSRAV